MTHRSQTFSWSILVVDDDSMIRTLLRLMLETANFTVTEAQNGSDALDKVKRVKPDAMILNVMMPQMDGYAVCEALRNETATADLPIIMLSGQANVTAINKGLLAGASRYLTKPVSRTNLLSSLREVLYEIN